MRNKFNVWSYADERAPPDKIRAHSEPRPSIANGCKNWAKNVFVESIDANIINLKTNKYIANQWDRVIYVHMLK